MTNGYSKSPRAIAFTNKLATICRKLEAAHHDPECSAEVRHYLMAAKDNAIKAWSKQAKDWEQ